MNYYLALDCGGSKLEAILFDEHLHLLSRARTGGVNANFISSRQVEEHYRDCYARLFAGISFRRLTSIVGNCALEPAGNCLPAGVTCEALEYVSEGAMGLLASRHYPDGVVILSGTGSDVYYIRDGQMADVIGGMGALLGDDGSGYEIGREGLRAALAMEEAGEAGPLLEEVRASFPAGSLRDTLLTVYRDPAPVRVIASCSRPVCTAARRGDSRALHILEAAGIRLAEQAAAMIRRHQLPADIPLCVMGGSFKGHPALLESLRGALRNSREDRRIHTPVFEPVVGAALHIGAKKTGCLSEETMNTARREFSEYLYRAEQGGNFYVN